MSFRGVGYRGWGETPEALDAGLRQIAEAGFGHAEVGGGGGWEGTDLLIAGRVHGRQLARLTTVLDRHRDRLRYTLHGPGEADLFDASDPSLHERLLRGGLEVARAIGATVMVVHPGQRRPWPGGSPRPMEELRAREREILSALAEEAAGWGGRIALETWLPPSDNVRWGYSYAAWPEQLAAQIEAVGHPALGVCLDTGHLWASANWYGFDFLAGVARLAPLVNHVHLQDIAGGAPLVDAIGNPVLGLGDQHLPPGWGDIPFTELLAVDFPRRPVLMVELMREQYRSLLPDVLADVRRWAGVGA